MPKPRCEAFAEKLHIGHDRLVRMVGSPMCDVRFVVGNADHQTRRSCGPVDGGARRSRGAIADADAGNVRQVGLARCIEQRVLRLDRRALKLWRSSDHASAVLPMARNRRVTAAP
jgi:hypothetical protein